MTDIHQIAATAFRHPTRSACVESQIGHLMAEEARKMRQPNYGGCVPEKAPGPSAAFQSRSPEVLKILAHGPQPAAYIARRLGISPPVTRSLMRLMRVAGLVYFTHPEGIHKPALWWAA